MVREVKKVEAIERMKSLGIRQDIIRDFSLENKIYISFPDGDVVCAEGEIAGLVKTFEHMYGAVVFHIFESIVDGDVRLSYLFVSDYPDEWGFAKEDMKRGFPFVYVENLTHRENSEFGTIGIESNLFGGFERTA